VEERVSHNTPQTKYFTSKQFPTQKLIKNTHFIGDSQNFKKINKVLIFPSGSCVLLLNLIKEKSGTCLVLLHQDRRKMMRALSPIGKVDTMLLESLINSLVGGILLRGNLVGVNFLPFGLLMILQPLYVLLQFTPLFVFNDFDM